MADEQNSAGQNGATQNGQPPQQDQGQPRQQGDGTPQPGPVPYERFKEVNEQLKELRDWKQSQETAQKAAQDKQLAEQQKWQELAEKRERELAQVRTEQLRTRIAMQKGIPADLIDRLQGDSAEEIATDADRLLAFLKPATGPGVPPASKGGQPTSLDISNMTMDEVRKNAAALTKQAFQ